jgi:hypothetical protein
MSGCSCIPWTCSDDVNIEWVKGVANVTEIFAPQSLVISKAELPVVKIGPYQAQFAKWAGHAFAFEVFPKGFPPGGDLAWQGLYDNLCQCPHWGYVFRGEALLQMADGHQTVVHAGDLYYCPPGHRISAIEDFENIEWNPARELEHSITTFSRNLKEGP